MSFLLKTYNFLRKDFITSKKIIFILIQKIMVVYRVCNSTCNMSKYSKAPTYIYILTPGKIQAKHVYPSVCLLKAE